MRFWHWHRYDPWQRIEPFWSLYRRTCRVCGKVQERHDPWRGYAEWREDYIAETERRRRRLRENRGARHP